jgi:flagellar biogenesis protein FliO
MPIHDWAQFALSVTFVFLLLAACLWWLAKRKGGFLVNRVNKPIQIEDTLQLGIKHRLMLVKVDDYKVLVSVTPNEMQTLHAWRISGQIEGSIGDTSEHPEELAFGAQTASGTGVAAGKKSFKESLGEFNAQN